MGDTISVTDDDGNEYRVDEDDLREADFTNRLEEMNSAITSVNHRPSHAGYDLVVDLKRDAGGTFRVFGDETDSAEILREAGYEAELAFYEAYKESIYPNESGGLYFHLHEV